MQPTDIPKLILEAKSDDQELPRLAREIGQELSINRGGLLDELRTSLEETSRDAGDFTRGFLQALAEVVRGYQAEELPKEQVQRASAQARLRDWGPALQAMANGPVLPTELRTFLGEAELSSVSRLLKDMRNMGLVDLFSSPGVDGRMRPHHLTLLGKRVLEGLSTLNPENRVRRVRTQENTTRSPVEKRSDLGSQRPLDSFLRLATTIPQIERRSSTGS